MKYYSGAFIALFFFFLPVASYACSCQAPAPVEESFRDAAAVFRGTVIAATEDSQKGMIYRVRLDEIFKGVEGETVVVIGGHAGGGCGVFARVGDEYLWYLNRSGQELQASICSRTKIIAQATDDLTALRKLP